MGLKKPTALGMYIFAGGFSLGVREHFKILGHLEDGPFGAETSRVNLRIPVHEDPAEWPVSDFEGVDLIYANPPCATWSMAGKRDTEDWHKDARVNCWRRIVDDVVPQLMPKVVLIESVRLAFSRGHALMCELARSARRHGYQATAIFEDAKDCGVPQPRPRFMLALHRVALFPKPTGMGDPPPVSAFLKLAKRELANQVRPPTSPHLQKLLKHVKPGDQIYRVFDRLHPDPPRNARGHRAGRPGFLPRRLHPDGLAFTMTGGCHWFHPTEDRLVTVAECAALCGFPTDYHFIGGGVQGAYAQLGKGVMPPVAEHMAGWVRASIERAQPANPVRTVALRIGRETVETEEITL